MDDILLFGLKSNSKTPADLEVVGESLQVEPYACMLPKDDPQFKALVDGVIIGMMKSGEFEKLYDKWFMQPIPPKNLPIGLPMSPQLQDNIKAPSDKPATLPGDGTDSLKPLAVLRTCDLHLRDVKGALTRRAPSDARERFPEGQLLPVAAAITPARRGRQSLPHGAAEGRAVDGQR